MFKKKNIEKKTDINKDLQSIQTRREEDSNSKLAKSAQYIKISKDDKNPERQQRSQEPKRLAKYGLIEKQVREVQEKPKLQNFFLNMYIKRRLSEIQVKEKREANDTTAIEILQMQKQYLSAAESKITEYDVKEIQKKLEKMAIDHIKTEMEGRNAYLNNLLQNQHERMEYASKKEIKLMKQDRERLQRDLSSKYKEEGRRHYIEYVKTNNLNGNY